MTAIKAISAQTVFDSVGICTHIDFNRYGYQNLPVTITALQYLGVKHIRECLGNPNDLTGPRAWSVVAKATGASFLSFIGETDPASAQQQLDMYAPMAAQGFLEYVEGPNEWDDAYPVSRGTSLPLAAAFQQKVWAVGQTLKLPVVNISFGSGWVPPLYHGNYDKVGDLSQWCDYSNAHTYPGTGQSPEWTIQRMNGLAHMAAASRPVMHTEYGYNSSQGFLPADMARNDLFAILDSIYYGCIKLYFYALFDDGSGLFGLMNQDGTPKLSGTAVKNLLAILSDTGPSKEESLDVSLASANSANDKMLLMEKADGRFLLALWNETDGVHNITLSFTTPAKTVNIYDPIAGTGIQQTLSNVTQAVVSLPTHPILVEIIGANVIQPLPSTQVPISIGLNPSSITLPDNSAVGITVSLVSVTTDDGKPFAGISSITGPFKLIGNIITLNGALTVGPLTADVTATENGTSIKATLAINVVAALPVPPQTPTSVTLTPSSVTIDDQTTAGTVLCNHLVKTSDGKAFAGTVTGDSMVDIVGATVVLKGALPPGPGTVSGTVTAMGNNISATAILGITLTHGITPPPPPPPPPPVVVTQTPNPQWGPPASIVCGVGATLKIAGLAVSDQWAVGHAGTCALNINTVSGTVSLNGTDGKPLAGSGTNRLRLNLNLADVNSALMTLAYTAPAVAGPDTLTMAVYDQSGKAKGISIPITVS